MHLRTQGDHREGTVRTVKALREPSHKHLHRRYHTSQRDHYATHVEQHNTSPLPLMYEVDLDGMLGVRVCPTTRKRGRTYIHSVRITFMVELDAQRSSKDRPCLCSDPDRPSAMAAPALSLFMALPSPVSTPCILITDAVDCADDTFNASCLRKYDSALYKL